MSQGGVAGTLHSSSSRSSNIDLDTLLLCCLLSSAFSASKTQTSPDFRVCRRLLTCLDTFNCILDANCEDFESSGVIQRPCRAAPGACWVLRVPRPVLDLSRHNHNSMRLSLLEVYWRVPFVVLNRMKTSCCARLLSAQSKPHFTCKQKWCAEQPPF